MSSTGAGQRWHEGIPQATNGTDSSHVIRTAAQLLSYTPHAGLSAMRTPTASVSMSNIWLVQRRDDGPFRVVQVDRKTGLERGAVDAFRPPPMSGDSARLLLAQGGLWVAAGHAMVYRVDLSLSQPAIGVAVGPHHLDGFAALDQAVFVSDYHMLARIRATDLALTTTTDVGATGLAAGDGVLWGRANAQILAIDSDALAILHSVDLGAFVLDLGFAQGSVWATTLESDRAQHRDHATLWEIVATGAPPIARARVQGRPSLAVGPAGVWLGLDGTDDLSELAHYDPLTGALKRVAGARFSPVFVDTDSVWGLEDSTGSIVRYRPASATLQKIGSVGGTDLAVEPEAIG